MRLKRYQTETLSVLRRFLEEARIAGPKSAYESVTRESDQAERLGRYGGTYTPLSNLANVPYACLRLPTGGGKTILGTYAIAVAREAWVEKDYPMVLWLVPSNTIRLQTVEALKNTRHPYRQVLDEAFGGRVRIFDIADFTHIRPQDIRDYLCLVVGTIQSLRVTNTEGRRVYAHHEDLEPHFASLTNTAPGLETSEDGTVKYSFANLMHIHRPLMIVDEAHNAVTNLTRDMQARVNPSAIIEFTATPQLDSNTLHRVSAQELKSEDMVKLPIVLSEHDTWQDAVSEAVAMRASLEERAGEDSGYIRPIILFQAQPRDEDVPVESLEKHLIEVEHIPREQIAIATGDQRELDDVDLFDPNCKVNYVITVEALKEGWDCSFAYVFCSVSRIRSAVSVEQLLGRVMRMPYAKRRPVPELNKAYAFLSEPSFGEAARGLVDKLVAMGFEEDEAFDNIEPQQPGLDLGDLFGPEEIPEPTFKHTVTAAPEVREALERSGNPGLAIHDTEDGTVEIVIKGRIDGKLEKTITELIPESDRKSFTKAVAQYRVETKDQLSPAEKGGRFVLPRLMSEIQGTFEFADTDAFMDLHEWSLLEHPVKFTESDFSIRTTARHYEIDIDGNRVTYQFTDEENQVPLDITVEGWTEQNLIIWLDQQVRQTDIHQSELLRWLSDLVRHLTGSRGISVAALMRFKYILARKVRDQIARIRQEERDKVYQDHLFASEARVDVSFDFGFTFQDGMYRDERRYRGHWKPSKHFLGSNQVPALDGKDDGEELQCAQAIDSLSEVKCWIRNVSKHPRSFWLPTATDRFYPDFVALLNDGRLLVVEYKGWHIVDSRDTDEKRAIGRLWEKQSDGKCLFLVVEKDVGGRGMRQQLSEKIQGTQH